MLNEHAKLLAVFRQTGEIIGRKKLQKLIYIAKKLDFPFFEKYQFHFYGPYSEELNLRMEEMCHLSFVTEVREKKSGYYQYRYSLSDQGDEFLKLSKYHLPETKDVLNELNEQSSKFLELVSTVLYFENLPKEDVLDKVFTLKAKQNYSVEDVEEAYRFIDHLKGKCECLQ
ncbi:YwgA family protein [Evansella tamaricis]|uniref:YwgA family protein n=1 Tax=Evansella tamaricis TaxID=2069301 RepID=A0ABS6JND4_9BACI|nr:YwgA family protein [Evansella tamaricis]MBU9714885.1 YwgA family protein [Evansella tamaricis]